MRQFQCDPTIYVCYRKKITIFKFIFLPSPMHIVFASFNHLEMQISFKIPVTLLQIVYTCMTATAPNSCL